MFCQITWGLSLRGLPSFSFCSLSLSKRKSPLFKSCTFTLKLSEIEGDNQLDQDIFQTEVEAENEEKQKLLDDKNNTTLNAMDEEK